MPSKRAVVLAWPEVQDALRAGSGASLLQLYKALYSARKVAPNSEAASTLLVGALDHVVDSVLLRHEICYVLGQTGDSSASKRLHEILVNEKEHEVVRHEAAEALAALGPSACGGGSPTALVEELEALAKNSSSLALRHTCELAAEGLRRQAAKAWPRASSEYDTMDPALGKASATAADVSAATAALLDEARSLYDRYEGMFTLRNAGGPEAVAGLSKALLEDKASALLRHEVAFVLGQMAKSKEGPSLGLVAPLRAALAKPDETPFVRHEAAISLGFVGSSEADEALQAHKGDPDALVSESCRVALEALI